MKHKNPAGGRPTRIPFKSTDLIEMLDSKYPAVSINPTDHDIPGERELLAAAARRGVVDDLLWQLRADELSQERE